MYSCAYSKGVNLGGGGMVGSRFQEINKGAPLLSCDNLCPNVVQINPKIWSRLKLHGPLRHEVQQPSSQSTIWPKLLIGAW